MPSDKSTQLRGSHQNDDSNVEIITPLTVRSRSGQPDSPRPLRSAVITIIFFFAVLAATATGGVIFIRYLSRHPVHLAGEATKTTQRPADSVTTPAPVPVEREDSIEPRKAMDSAKYALEKETAEKELAAFLKLKKALDEKGVSEWGGKAYDELINLGREADALFLDNAFLAAAEKYARAGKKASDLAGDTQNVFLSLLREGEAALENGDSNTARRKFRAALMIQPSSASAQRNLERAENLDAVNRLIESGKNHEENNRFAFSHADYQEALKLDPESREARLALDRVKERIVGEQFQKLMSDGLTEFHDGNYQPARSKLLAAKSFRPDSREVREALQQVDEAIRLDKIEKLRQTAMTAEQAEDWEQALKSYLAILEIDPNISFAIQGKERSLEQIQIAKRITFLLQRPDTLESDQQFQNAMLVIAEAEKLQPRGPQLNARLDQLKNLADAAGTPVSVTIESDNLTKVVIYKVGEFGRFAFREISLRPGIYTVVGSRNGYRDVRQKVIVKPGQKALRVTVICSIEVEH